MLPLPLPLPARERRSGASLRAAAHRETRVRSPPCSLLHHSPAPVLLTFRRFLRDLRDLRAD